MSINLNKIEEELTNYNHFEECVIDEIRFSEFGTTINILIDNIWDENNKLRKNLSEKSNIQISFSIVQEFTLHNAMNTLMINEINRLDSGINVISMIKIEDAKNYTSIYSDIPVNFIMSILWEGGWRIDIVFRYCSITKLEK